MMGLKPCVFRFFDIEVREEELRVTRAGQPVAIEPKAFRVLLYLLHHAGHLVSKNELLDAVWGETAVSDNSLTRAIALLRRVLEDDTHQPHFIETVATAGYRFICPVETEQDGESRMEAARAVSDGAGLPTRSPESGAVASASAESRATARMRWAVACVSVVLLVAIVGVFLYFIRPLPPPRIIAYTQLTNDGRSVQVVGTNGISLFLNARNPAGVAQVPVTGGQVAQIPLDLPGAQEHPDDIPVLRAVSPDGSSLLVAGHLTAPDWADYWIVGALGHPARHLTEAHFPAWSADGNSVVYSNPHGDILTIPTLGGEPRMVVPSTAPMGARIQTINLQISPDGSRIRFVRNFRIWEVASSGANLHELLPGWHPSAPMCCGRWTPDGDFFLFVSGERAAFAGYLQGAQIWVLDERHGGMRPPNPRPTQLTNGPTIWTDLVMSRDGRTAYSVGLTIRGQLVRLDPASKQLLPYLAGISAEYVDFSRDGKYLAYVTFPEGALWRANRDGSGLMQLTQPPVYPKNIRWSPDGTQILFHDTLPSGQEAIFTVSSQGGSPKRLLPADNDVEGDPTWSPDGKKIVFTRSVALIQNRHSKPETQILEIATGQTTTLPPPPEYFWSPRWSPDGRYIVGINFPPDQLEVFDLETGKWSILHPQQGRLDYPCWSRDGRFIYFLVSDLMTRAHGYQGVYRIEVATGRVERIVDLRGISLTGWYTLWLGLDLDDTPLLLRDAGNAETYALTLERK
jgi:DNA-binding winged helix-turn-helix (wHTH) protein/Tol biopolymer transport system component